MPLLEKLSHDSASVIVMSLAKKLIQKVKAQPASASSVGGGAKRLVGRAESEPRLPDEGTELAGPLDNLRVVRGALDLVEHLRRSVEPDDVELVPEEAPLSAFHDEVYVLEVGLDVRGLKSLVGRVDESLGLCPHPA